MTCQFLKLQVLHHLLQLQHTTTFNKDDTNNDTGNTSTDVNKVQGAGQGKETWGGREGNSVSRHIASQAPGEGFVFVFI